MEWWALAPGLTLIVAGYVLQFGRYLRPSPERSRLALLGDRLRFVGIGALLAGIGADLAISGLLDDPQGSLIIGLVMIVFAGTWFYAASDRIFRGG